MKAIILNLSAWALLPFMDAIAKYLSAELSFFQITWARYFFTVVWTLPLMYFFFRETLTFSKNLKLQIIRGLTLFFANICFFYSISIISMAKALTLAFVAPLITTALSPFFLKEKVGLRRWIAIIFGFIGVLIVFRPGTSLFSYYSLLPLLGAIALSFAVIIMKKLLSYDSPTTCSFYLHLFVALIYSPLLFFDWQHPSLNLWIMLIGMGFCGGIAQILLTNAYRLSSVNLLQPFDYTAIIWAITFGLIFFNDYPDRYVIIGSIVIVISTYYIIYRETKLGKKINTLKINQRQI